MGWRENHSKTKTSERYRGFLRMLVYKWLGSKISSRINIMIIYHCQPLILKRDGPYRGEKYLLKQNKIIWIKGWEIIFKLPQRYLFEVFDEWTRNLFLPPVIILLRTLQSLSVGVTSNYYNALIIEYNNRISSTQRRKASN